MAYERPLCSHEIADKFIENDCESRTLCGCIFPAPAFHSLSLSLTLSVSFLCCLSLALSVPVALGCMFPSCNMQEFLRKNIDDLANVHWKGKIHWAAAIRMAARQPGAWRLAAVTCWHLPVTSCQALNILAHEFSQSFPHNSAKHEKRISKTELQ